MSALRKRPAQARATTAREEVPARPQLMRPVRGLLPAALMGGLSTAAGVALTATSGWLIVKASHRPIILTLMVAIVGVRAFGIARPALRYAERILSHNAALKDLAQRRTDVYRSLIPLTPARLGRRGRADLLTGVVRDVDDEEDVQLRSLVPLIGSALTALLAIVTAFVLLPAAGVVLIGMTLLSLIVCAIDYRMERDAQRRTLNARAEVAAVSTLASANTAELQAIGAPDVLFERLATAQRRLVRATAAQARGRATGAFMATLVVGIGMLAMAYSVVPAVRAGTLPGPTAALLALFPVALNDALVALPDALGALARGRAAHTRLTRLLGQTPAVRDALPGSAAPDGDRHTAPDLRFTQVSAKWDKEIALAPTNLHVRPGEVVAIAGPNGVGKSTLLAVLARHLDPAGGRYDVGGIDVRRTGLDAVRSQFAVMDDEPHVFASTLRENLRLAKPDASDEELLSALRRAGLRTWYAGLADGLDTMLGTDGRGISGGERARLALARALLSGRRVMLLDEPVAHLDHATAEAVLADVIENSTGRTVIIVSHRDDGLEGVDRTITLR